MEPEFPSEDFLFLLCLGGGGGGGRYFWETDFYAPPVLRGAALFDNAAPAVYKNHVP